MLAWSADPFEIVARTEAMRCPVRPFSGPDAIKLLQLSPIPIQKFETIRPPRRFRSTWKGEFLIVFEKNRVPSEPFQMTAATISSVLGHLGTTGTDPTDAGASEICTPGRPCVRGRRLNFHGGDHATAGPRRPVGCNANKFQALLFKSGCPFSSTWLSVSTPFAPKIQWRRSTTERTDKPIISATTPNCSTRSATQSAVWIDRDACP